MSVHVPCAECGTVISSTFARVFGDNTDTPHACFHCSTVTAVKHGAASSPTHDGTPLAHYPNHDDPQPVVTDDGPPASDDRDPISLDEVRNRGHARIDDTAEDGFTHSDDDFQALVAE